MTTEEELKSSSIWGGSPESIGKNNYVYLSTRKLIKIKQRNKIPSEGFEGNWDAIEEGLDLETNMSSSFENWSSVFELTFMTLSSFREAEQKVGKKRVKLQNEKGDEVT